MGDLPPEDAHWQERAQQKVDAQAKPPGDGPARRAGGGSGPPRPVSRCPPLPPLCVWPLISAATAAPPAGSLDLLEAWAVRLSVLQRSLTPRLDAARLVVFAADHVSPPCTGLLWGQPICCSLAAARPNFSCICHASACPAQGLTAEGQTPGVSAYPRVLTASVFRAIAAGRAASATLCAANSVALELVDVGVDAEVSRVHAAPGVSLVHAKVRRGSRSMLAGPALSADELQAALAAGAAAVTRAAEAAPGPPSTCVLCIGELGIGNTTAAAAVLAAMTGAAPQAVCGRGSGEHC